MRGDAAVQHRGSAQGELGLVVLGLGVGDAFRQVALTEAFELDWPLTAGAGDADGVGSELEEELAGERAVPRVHWLESRGDIPEIVTAGEAAQREIDRAVAVVVSWAVPRRQADHATPHLADHAVLAIASGRVPV